MTRQTGALGRAPLRSGRRWSRVARVAALIAECCALGSWWLTVGCALLGAVAVRNGHIKRITDQDIQSSVLEIMGTNVSTNYITCPADPQKTLGIKLPFLVMIIKNLKKYFTFEVQVLDDKNVRRRFRASNYQVSSETPRAPFVTRRCSQPPTARRGNERNGMAR